MLEGYKPTTLDYPEDFKMENGNYEHECLECHRKFHGHKRRFVCKECRNNPEE
jgi:Zn finger protein HypA/HybF involved in hydrogenase expression